jgi:calcineurin-like phosphoesterase family protein
MDDKMVENWNSLVKPNDMVFHLGDFCFGSIENWKAIRSRLNGTIRLIRGNHDKFQTGQISDLFESVNDYLKIRVKDEDGNQGWQFLILSHYAFRVWDQCHHNSFSLFGHSHGNLPDDPSSLSFDVGVDCHDFCPISYDQVKQIMSKKTVR